MDASGRKIKKWVAAWQRATVALEQVRRTELRALDTAEALRQLEGPFAHALKRARPTASSGLVQQQKIFKKIRNA